jgi:lipoprotein signal peptidase
MNLPESALSSAPGGMMPMNRTFRLEVAWMLAFAVGCGDQLAKWLALRIGDVTLISGRLMLHADINWGLPFGIAEGAPFARWGSASMLSTWVLGLSGWLIFKRSHRVLAGVLLGAYGSNLLDLFVRGGVVDYIDVATYYRDGYLHSVVLNLSDAPIALLSPFSLWYLIRETRLNRLPANRP